MNIKGDLSPSQENPFNINNTPRLNVADGPRNQFQDNVKMGRDTDLYQVGSDLGGSPFGLFRKFGNQFNPHEPKNHLPEDTQQPYKSLQLETNPSELGKDCVLHAYSRQPNGGSRAAALGQNERQFVKVPVFPAGGKDCAGISCLMSIGSESNYAQCETLGDSGAPIFCGNKLTYMADRHNGECTGSAFKAYHVPKMQADIADAKKAKTPTVIEDIGMSGQPNIGRIVNEHLKILGPKIL